jgi:putative transposase
MKANAFGFYPLNGTPVLGFRERSTQGCVRSFLKRIRKMNPKGRIILILDNFRSHHARTVKAQAKRLNIVLVFLPPYSPDLNPIEFIWKDVKRAVSSKFIKNPGKLKRIIKSTFLQCALKLSYSKSWIKNFHPSFNSPNG